MTQKLSLDAVAREQLEAAGRSPAGRAAHTAVGGHEHVMRQTVIALLRGRSLAEHVNPGEATVHALRGPVRLAQVHGLVGTATNGWVPTGPPPP